MPVVLITAGHTVYYSLNNGMTLSEFEDKQLYDVPWFAANGMISRQWAKLATMQDIAGHQETQPEASPDEATRKKKAR